MATRINAILPVSLKRDKINKDFVSERVHSFHKKGCHFFRRKIEISGDTTLKSRSNRTKNAASLHVCFDIALKIAAKSPI